MWEGKKTPEVFSHSWRFLNRQREGKHPWKKKTWKKHIPPWFGVFVFGNQPDFGESKPEWRGKTMESLYFGDKMVGCVEL